MTLRPYLAFVDTFISGYNSITTYPVSLVGIYKKEEYVSMSFFGEIQKILFYKVKPVENDFFCPKPNKKMLGCYFFWFFDDKKSQNPDGISGFGGG
jgi:hypothetical protein